jgi:hypothetical protein
MPAVSAPASADWGRASRRSRRRLNRHSRSGAGLGFECRIIAKEPANGRQEADSRQGSSEFSVFHCARVSAKPARRVLPRKAKVNSASEQMVTDVPHFRGIA